MKILIFNWRDIKNPDAGGAEVHLQETFKRIVKKGHEVVLISSKFDGCENTEVIDGINVIRIGNKFNFNFMVPFYYLTKLKNDRFDIVIDDISKIPLCTPLYIRKPLIAIIHHVHGRTLFKELPFAMAAYVWLSERLLIPIYKRKKIIAVSDSTKDEISRMGIPKENITVIHNGNHNYPSVKIEKSKTSLIVYVGRIRAYKQLDHLVRAFKIVRNKIEDSKLIIAGKGDKSILKDMAISLGLESSVAFYDNISENKKMELLSKAWVFVIPSMKEGWGITVIEANSCGTPVVGYDVEGLKDSIKNNETGLLVRSGNIEELATSIIRIIENKDFREQLNKNVIKWSERFDWNKSAEELLKIM